MIPLLILLTFFQSSFQKTELNFSKISLQSTIIHTSNSLSDYTIQNGNNIFFIGNPNNFLNLTYDLYLSNSYLSDIYIKKRLKLLFMLLMAGKYFFFF